MSLRLLDRAEISVLSLALVAEGTVRVNELVNLEYNSASCIHGFVFSP